MHRRFAAILCFVLLGLALAGCSKCGPFWVDFAPRACHADAPRG